MTTFFATASAGTEDLLAEELRPLGAHGIRPGRGGVRFNGELETALKACLWVRTGMRILLPLKSFPAADDKQLYDGARSIEWKKHLGPHNTFAVEASSTARRGVRMAG